MYIYQIERDLLRREICRNGKALSGRLLDVGSGRGSPYRDLFPRVGEVVRLDINPEYHPDLLGSADNIPAEADSFDAIICTQVLGDVLEPLKAMKEFHRVLKPGGVALISEGFLNEVHGAPRDYFRFTQHGLAALAAEAGFEAGSVLTGGSATVAVQMFTRVLINGLRLYEHERAGRLFSLLFRFLGAVGVLADKCVPKRINQNFGLNAVLLAKKIP